MNRNQKTRHGDMDRGGGKDHYVQVSKLCCGVLATSLVKTTAMAAHSDKLATVEYSSLAADYIETVFATWEPI